MTRLPLVGLLAASGFVLSIDVPKVRAQAQTAASPIAFEVASVKPGIPGLNAVRGGCHGIDSKYGPHDTAVPPLGRCVITDSSLSHLILIAYDLHSIDLIEGAKDWEISGEERFTIEAKAEDPTKATEGQLLQMLQALLADRFKLRFHRQTREAPGFALVIAKNGPKLREATGDTIEKSFSPSMKGSPGVPASFTARKVSMPMLVDFLSLIGPGPVVDDTGLVGAYDFKLSWEDSAGPSLFTAIQEQLGLRLEPRKVPLSFFVIESAERPGEN